MAHGLVCRYCGWQETAHKGNDEIADNDFVTALAGYKKSLAKCGRFVYKKEELKLLPKLEELDGCNPSTPVKDDMGNVC